MVDIIQAITVGNIEQVKQALAEGASPDTPGKDSLYAIHIAVMANHKDIFDLLISHHANPKITDSHNNTTLYFGARAGVSAEFIEAIIKTGVNINSQNQLGQTATHVAARLGKVEALQTLLKNGVDVNIKDITGKTPLHDAIKTNHPEDVLSLLEYGASTKIKDNYGATAIDLAKAATNLEFRDLFELPIDKLKINIKNPLFVATVSDDVAGVEAALDKGLSVNSGNANGMTPLHFAVLHGYDEVIDTLAEKGAVVNQTDYQGHQAIHFAAMTSQVDIVDKLFSMGAVPNAYDSMSNTPLHYAAAQHDGAAFVEKLLDAGANVNIQNNNGDTPLHIAANHGYLDIVKDLVEHGADRTLVNKQGETPAQDAAHALHKDVADYLDQKQQLNIKKCPLDINLDDVIDDGNAIPNLDQLRTNIEDIADNAVPRVDNLESFVQPAPVAPIPEIDHVPHDHIF